MNVSLPGQSARPCREAGRTPEHERVLLLPPLAGEGWDGGNEYARRSPPPRPSPASCGRKGGVAPPLRGWRGSLRAVGALPHDLVRRRSGRPRMPGRSAARDRRPRAGGGARAGRLQVVDTTGNTMLDASRGSAICRTHRSSTRATGAMPTSSGATAASPRWICCACASIGASFNPATASGARSRRTASSSRSPTTRRAACGCSTRTRWRCWPTSPPSTPRRQRAKVVGLEDAAKGRFAFSLFEAGEIWVADLPMCATRGSPSSRASAGSPTMRWSPRTGATTSPVCSARTASCLVDLWHPERGVSAILAGYGRGEQPLPVYKMPHLEGWAMAGRLAYLPPSAATRCWWSTHSRWREVGAHRGRRAARVRHRAAGRASRLGQLRAAGQRHRAGHRHRIAHRSCGRCSPARAILHMEFTPRGEHVWIVRAR